MNKHVAGKVVAGGAIVFALVAGSSMGAAAEEAKAVATSAAPVLQAPISFSALPDGEDPTEAPDYGAPDMADERLPQTGLAGADGEAITGGRKDDLRPSHMDVLGGVRDSLPGGAQAVGGGPIGPDAGPETDEPSEVSRPATNQGGARVSDADAESTGTGREGTGGSTEGLEFHAMPGKWQQLASDGGSSTVPIIEKLGEASEKLYYPKKDKPKEWTQEQQEALLKRNEDEAAREKKNKNKKMCADECPNERVITSEDIEEAQERDELRRMSVIQTDPSDDDPDAIDESRGPRDDNGCGPNALCDEAGSTISTDFDDDEDPRPTNIAGPEFDPDAGEDPRP